MTTTEFAQALWDCPQMLGRVQSALEPDRYTLGEVELLRMLGYDAGRVLDWEDWPDPQEMAEIRNPRASVAWSEELYASQTCTLAEWVLAEGLFGGTYGSAGMCVDEVDGVHTTACEYEGHDCDDEGCEASAEAWEAVHFPHGRKGVDEEVAA